MIYRKISSIFTCALLTIVIFSSCNDPHMGSDPLIRVWYGNNGMIIESKGINDKPYGKWKYTVRDNFGLILIRSSEEWEIGDTLYINTTTP